MENNTKAKKNCGATYLITAVAAFILTVAGVFVYQFIPVSDIANSTEYSAETGLYLLSLAPVFALAAFIVYLVGGLTDKALVKNSVVQLVIFIVSSVLLCFIAVTSAAMLISQFSLGFAAPFDGTIWETLGIINIVAAVLFTVGNGYIFLTARK